MASQTSSASGSPCAAASATSRAVIVPGASRRSSSVEARRAAERLACPARDVRAGGVCLGTAAAAARRTGQPSIVDGQMAELAGVAAAAPERDARRNDTAADARGDREIDEVGEPTAGAPAPLGERGGGGVVVDEGGTVEGGRHHRRERHVVPAREVGRSMDDAGPRIEGPATGDADRRDVADGDAGRCEGRTPQVDEAGDHRVGTLLTMRRDDAERTDRPVRVDDARGELRAAHVEPQDGSRGSARGAGRVPGVCVECRNVSVHGTPSIAGGRRWSLGSGARSILRTHHDRTPERAAGVPERSGRPSRRR